MAGECYSDCDTCSACVDGTCASNCDEGDCCTGIGNCGTCKSCDDNNPCTDACTTCWDGKCGTECKLGECCDGVGCVRCNEKACESCGGDGCYDWCTPNGGTCTDGECYLPYSSSSSSSSDSSSSSSGPSGTCWVPDGGDCPCPASASFSYSQTDCQDDCNYGAGTLDPSCWQNYTGPFIPCKEVPC